MIYISQEVKDYCKNNNIRLEILDQVLIIHSSKDKIIYYTKSNKFRSAFSKGSFTKFKAGLLEFCKTLV